MLGGFDQYVLLGAGLDSLAWRRPDVVKSLKIFEIDHPASQSWKRERVAELALPVPETQVFVPVDFERQSLQSGLDQAGFDWHRPTLFAWLGVTPYLSPDAIKSTLATIAGSGPRSEVVFDYKSHDSVLDEIGALFIETFAEMAAASGEPLHQGWQRAEIEHLITSCGLSVLDHPTREDLIERYFADRSHGLMPYTAQGLVTASVG